jgi:hypothetical protein
MVCTHLVHRSDGSDVEDMDFEDFNLNAPLQDPLVREQLYDFFFGEEEMEEEECLGFQGRWIFDDFQAQPDPRPFNMDGGRGGGGFAPTSNAFAYFCTIWTNILWLHIVTETNRFYK